MLIYDSTNPAAIPADAEAIAPYVDGRFGPNHPPFDTGWDAAALARFPFAVKVPIACFGTTDDGVALDVERGCAAVSEAPDWVRMRIAAGVSEPWVYVNRSNGPAVEAALDAAGFTTGGGYIALWVATLDGTQTVTTWGNGAAIRYPVAAVQYANSTISGGDYDISITTAYGDATKIIGGQRRVKSYLIQNSAGAQAFYCPETGVCTGISDAQSSLAFQAVGYTIVKVSDAFFTAVLDNNSVRWPLKLEATLGSS